MSTHNIGYMKKWRKLSLNYHQISSYMHLIYYSGFILGYQSFERRKDPDSSDQP